MDVERSVLSKIIATRDLKPITDSNITANFFADKDSRNVFLSILKHKSEYGEVPTLGAIKLDHPTYKFVNSEESYDYLVDKLRESRTHAILDAAAAAFVEQTDARKHKDATATLSRTLSQLGTEIQSTRDTDLTVTGDERIERYKSYKDFDGGLRGIPSGFSSIDRATLGFQQGQLNVFIGPPKAGKSTLMVLATIAALRHGVRPLFIGFEMSNEEQEERIDAIMAGISHSRLRSGSLTKDEWKKLEKHVRNLENMPSLTLSADPSSVTTLSGIAGKIDAIQPDIVFVDGIYMMEDENGERKNSPQALTNLTRGFKRMAQVRKLPINISTQVLEHKMSKSKGITSDSIGYSSSFAQDADNILGVLPTEDEDVQEVSIVISRNAPKMKLLVAWDWETGEFNELSEDVFDPGSVSV